MGRPTFGRRGLARLIIRTISLGLFLLFLGAMAFPPADLPLPPDSFLRLDPLLSLSVPLAAREWIPSLLPGLGLILLTVFFGRIFCGYICPMGITLDVSRFLSGRLFPGLALEKAGRPAGALFGRADSAWRKIKFMALAVILGAALCGLNLAYWGSPIPLITRFYALLLHPLAALLGSEGLTLLRPLFSGLDLTTLEYLQIPSRHYSGVIFVLGFFLLLFLLELVRPRFWCRYLCPAGAILALASGLPRIPWLRRLFGPAGLRLPGLHREVGKCLHCGKCVRACPTAAIAESGCQTAHPECIACRSCVRLCPVEGVRFTFREGAALSAKAERSACSAPAEDCGQASAQARPVSLLPSRRAFVAGAVGGAVLAAVSFTDTFGQLRPFARGILWPPEAIRPPGALPEPDFLTRCIRCGACMKACPSNALQPAWPNAGAGGLFSPVLMARRGPCEPNCNACGQVCPSRAITALPLEEKQWAKIGTAVVQPGRCLAFAEGKRCVVCQEVCPYGSIKLLQTADSAVPVPVVDHNRCFGCGYCENHCPVRLPAIIVEPLNSLRLNAESLAGGSYREYAQSIGLQLEPGTNEAGSNGPDGQDDFYGTESLQPGSLPPGFTE